MTSPSSPSWYDVLDVDRDATPEQIKAAWRHATDRFEPGSGSGQFRMFNEAADVLLDPERRAAYDAQLDESAPAPEAGSSSGPEKGQTDVTPLAPTHVDTDEQRRQRRAERRGRRKHSTGKGAGKTATAVPVGRLGRTHPAVLAVLAVLTIAALVAAVLLGMRAQEQAKVASARDEAPAAAERAVKALFSYDYANLAADRKRAQGYLSPRFATSYLKNFDALEKQQDGSPGLAVQTKAVVTTDVQGSGVVDVSDSGTVARVLVFVNLNSRKAQGDPQIFQNRVAMTMKKDGDRWLVDKVDSY